MIAVAIIAALVVLALALLARDAHKRHLVAHFAERADDTSTALLVARLDAVEAREKESEGEIAKLQRTVHALGEGRKR